MGGPKRGVCNRNGCAERDRIQMFSRSSWAMGEPRPEGGLGEEMRHRVNEGSRDTSKC